MQYLFVEQAGEQQLSLEGDEHRYIFKVRRHRQGEIITLRNLKDGKLYFYQIVSLTKKEALLSLEKTEMLTVSAEKNLHLAWCIIDPKSVEKMLASLNEVGVDKITFIYCKRSQKSFKLDFKRLEKIVLNSSQQCGRSSLMKLELIEHLEDFLLAYPNTIMLNFSEQKLSTISQNNTILIGCEGGFSPEESHLFNKENIMGLDTPLILKSESAACMVASKLL
ncbi:MAG: Ribosomal RNA small subunit methyltransferase E (EC [uncultured Sulfurovum sp.]|uniref:Ribosomal RNA small subunit methyltransferase E n=1 Tax=uncultured Sulfurovum sp. TaxID=269237 RepID=A0A6S6STH7_9BACT|nr:MAG: Ribosomal RNA small subunit methyltransferase E (EC [uncultured Sulfurovum sp.]